MHLDSWLNYFNERSMVNSLPAHPKGLHIRVVGDKLPCNRVQVVAGPDKLSDLQVCNFMPWVLFTRAFKLGVLLVPNGLFPSVSAASKPVVTYVLLSHSLSPLSPCFRGSGI